MTTLALTEESSQDATNTNNGFMRWPTEETKQSRPWSNRRLLVTLGDTIIDISDRYDFGLTKVFSDNQDQSIINIDCQREWGTYASDHRQMPGTIHWSFNPQRVPLVHPEKFELSTRLNFSRLYHCKPY
jgi:hypothetical protein